MVVTNICERLKNSFHAALLFTSSRLYIFGYEVRQAREIVLLFVYYRYLPSGKLMLAVSDIDRCFPALNGKLKTLAVDLKTAREPNLA